ncbi:MAG: YwqG family protein [Clostridium sp.]|nr:YwqG family protein [Clostridium sp.]MCM1546856.1 YwqG family protein [Ruminococcus sp.]
MGLFDIFKKKKSENTVSTESYLDHTKTLFTAVYHQIKKETEIPCIGISLTETKPIVFESKLGGIGYIPHDGSFPTDSKGNQLRILAQIECEKIKLDEFPDHGLLQFWIMPDDLYGADFDNNTKQEGFRIVYHETVDTTVIEEEIKKKIIPNEYEKIDDDCMPVYGEYGLEFSDSTSFMTEHDFRYEKIFCKKYNALNPPKKIKSSYDIEFRIDDMEDFDDEIDLSNAFGHKIGGYPAFTQWDPRSDEKYDFLLLQLDSDFSADNDKLMWGDAGICGFFINSEKLKALDFSDVIYSWDCY